MPLASRQRGPVALYGATGYTGRLTAAELRAADADFILSGRNGQKLERLAAELGGGVTVRPAPLDDPAALRALLADCAAVIDCAGPFIRYGEPVLQAAVETSTHYLDTTGEQPYMRLALDRYGPEAKRKGAAVIPGMGFDYVPGDMIASLTADGMGEVDEVALAYSVAGFGATRGTMHSALEMINGVDVEWRKLQWLPADQSTGRGSFDFGGRIGRQRMVRYPAGEQVTVPRHISTRRVRTAISAASLVPSPLAPAMPFLTRPAGLAMRTPLKRLLGAIISRLPEGPSESDRAAARFTIVCDVTRGQTLRRGAVSGSDVYGLTAATVAAGALTAARGGVSGAGGLAPSQAFEPRSFLEDLGRFHVHWDVEAARERSAVTT
ncbi:MAG TPA: saccharopine dehydrogenase NADP-binding domain-containing protein [Solirubrobacterales bacterium]|nr:saccharopine dehydrogenase NADP-binding domain-containing protein [Solirubrobacterales bacterium]